ncbi:MAG: hypothetical protein Q9210_005670 [Variospora velana]
MLGESIPLQDQRSSTPQRLNTTNAQHDGFRSGPYAFYYQFTPGPSGDSEPHTPNTVHQTPSISGQPPLPLNISSQSSSNSSPIEPLLSSPTTGNASRRVSPVDPLKRRREALKKSLQKVPISGDSTPRKPMTTDFAHPLQVQVIPKYTKEGINIKHVVVLLHGYGGTESSLDELASHLHGQHPETSFVLLRGPEPVSTPNSGYHWADRSDEGDGPFVNSEEILTQMIKSSLIDTCGFYPRNILLMGHGQGGMAVLATAALWEDIELGGAVSIGGPLPSYARSASFSKIKTPALVVGGNLGDLTPFALERIKNSFSTVDTCILPDTHDTVHDTVPDTDQSRKPLLEFFAHRLRQEEWKKQAVISFDGGGIRGYGSLLILRELMNRIGDEEHRLDALEGQPGKTESSFSPGLYKPVLPERRRTTSENSLTDDPTATTDPDRSSIEGLPNSSLFLPCHYFDYAAGTSTGGLISIMLSRLRMTVDDCISEYKAFGQKIFGSPRPLAFGAILWHKFNHKTLDEVLQSVTRGHSERSEEYELNFPSDEDFCRTLVMAYAEGNKTEAPYLFRTYYTSPPSAGLGKTKQRRTTPRNHGPPQSVPIWKIGRATSAAPKYFPPIRIEKSMGNDTQRSVRFKDGGFGCNNPSEEAYHDIVHKHGGVSEAVGPFISIGTGVTTLDLFAKISGNLPNALANDKAAKKHPSRTLNAHDAMTRWSHRDGKEVFPYYRFDGGRRLGEVELDEWESHRLSRLTKATAEPGFKTLDKMNVATIEFLYRQDVQRDLDECAKLLVKRRRLRARNDSAWDRYASASYYECSYQKCQRSRINTKQLFKTHVKGEHYSALADQPLEIAMKTSRRCWIYRNDPHSSRPKPQRTEPGVSAHHTNVNRPSEF